MGQQCRYATLGIKISGHAYFGKKRHFATSSSSLCIFGWKKSYRKETGREEEEERERVGERRFLLVVCGGGASLRQVAGGPRLSHKKILTFIWVSNYNSIKIDFLHSNGFIEKKYFYPPCADRRHAQWLFLPPPPFPQLLPCQIWWKRKREEKRKRSNGQRQFRHFWFPEFHFCRMREIKYFFLLFSLFLITWQFVCWEWEIIDSGEEIECFFLMIMWGVCTSVGMEITKVWTQKFPFRENGTSVEKTQQKLCCRWSYFHCSLL